MMRACILLSLVFMLSIGTAWAQTTITEDEKLSKRLQFNRYVEEELARIETERQTDEEQKRLSISTTVDYGYESNVTLDSNREGDLFHKESLDIASRFAHEGLPNHTGPGEYGVTVYTEYTGYQDEESSDNHVLEFVPFYEVGITDKVNLKFEYRLAYQRYIRNNQLDYRSNEIKSTVSVEHENGVVQDIYGLYEYQHFRDRAALSVSNTELTTNRKDRYYEAGTAFYFTPSDKSYVGTTVLIKVNESNDRHKNFNDYLGYALSGFVYQELAEKLSLIGFGGFDFIQYDQRTVTEDSAEAERDNFFYAGGNMTYALSDKTRLNLSYLYNQNGSNDPAQEYSGSTLSAGLILDL